MFQYPRDKMSTGLPTLYKRSVWSREEIIPTEPYVLWKVQSSVLTALLFFIFSTIDRQLAELYSGCYKYMWNGIMFSVWGFKVPIGYNSLSLRNSQSSKSIHVDVSFHVCSYYKINVDSHLSPRDTELEEWRAGWGVNSNKVTSLCLFLFLLLLATVQCMCHSWR